MIKIFAVSRAEDRRRPLELRTLQFPGGEVHVTVGLGVQADELQVHAHVQDSHTVMALLMVTDALRRGYPGKPISLCMPYVPYARQDRVANAGEALSAKVFCQLINAQGFERVVIQDPHSDVVSALLDRVEIEDPVPAMRLIVERLGNVALVAPDAGARKRVIKLASALDVQAVFAEKIRNTRTGAITGTQIAADLPDCALLVVDDICDGGRTFTELAMALRKRQSEQHIDRPLYLYVTHGIFSKGLGPLAEHYETIFTRNNWTSDTRCEVV